MANNSISKAGTTEPFELQVAKGEIYKHTALFKYGFHPACSTSEDTIWTYGGTVADYNWPTAADQVEVASPDANDTSAGTGARTIVIEGLDSNYAEISETITMNGQTPVTSANSYFRVHRAYVATAGTGLVNAGIIYVALETTAWTTGTPDTTTAVVTTIAAGDGQTLQGFYTVPASTKAYIYALTCSVGVASATAWANVSIRSRDVPSAEGFRRKVQHSFGIGATDRLEFCPPLVVTEKSDIEVRGDANTGTIAVNATMDIILVKD